MATLSVRDIAFKCLRKSGSLSLIRDIFSTNDVESIRSLEEILKFIREFRCPPRAPTNLRITNISKDSISITWDDNIDNEEGFEIIRRGRKEPVTQFSAHDDGSQRVGPNRTSFTLTRLFPGYEYCIRVRAFNRGGSNDSSEVCGSTPEPPRIEQGVSQVTFINMHVDGRTVHLWMRDITSGSSWSEEGSLSSQQQRTIPFSDEHTYQITAVDPDAINCNGRNNPDFLSCQRNTGSYQGNPNSSSFLNVTIS